MKHILLAAFASAGLMAIIPSAKAAVCADGVFRAGCAGPNGAAVVRKPYPSVGGYHHYEGSVTCARGVYRAGCAGPNGAVVRRREY